MSHVIVTWPWPWGTSINSIWRNATLRLNTRNIMLKNGSGQPQRMLRVVVWENRAWSKDGGWPNLIILWALDACLIWLWTAVFEQILVLLFLRLTTPLCFGAAGAKMAPEIRPTSRRKNTNFPMVFTNIFFYDTFMAIVTLDSQTYLVNVFFLASAAKKERSNKILDMYEFPTFLNDIFSKVRLFIFYSKHFLFSPFLYQLNWKKELIGGKPGFHSAHTWNW